MTSLSLMSATVVVVILSSATNFSCALLSDGAFVPESTPGNLTGIDVPEEETAPDQMVIIMVLFVVIVVFMIATHWVCANIICKSRQPISDSAWNRMLRNDYPRFDSAMFRRLQMRESIGFPTLDVSSPVADLTSPGHPFRQPDPFYHAVHENLLSRLQGDHDYSSFLAGCEREGRRPVISAPITR